MVMGVDTSIIKNDDDFERTVVLASTEYCLTNEGKETFKGNCNCFNWGDFDTYVSNEICEKYGIKKISSNVAREFIFDQQLVDEEVIFSEIE